jgi:nucleoid-associated protein YgaU
MALDDIQLRQPVAGDLIGTKVAIAAIGTAFEATYVWNLRAPDRVLAEGFFQAGSMGTLESFCQEVGVHTDYVGPATFELAGDDPSGQSAGLDAQSVAVIVIGGMQGYRLHQVVRGDTLSELARDNGSTVQKIAVANRLSNPDLIRVGQVLRIPV